ncbi:extracellular matrix regulator RemB [Oceanobacillus locisalsi]|uniref:Extracellular matrix regulator RemB n=1 Tax=Oceanobacillus locisalsi TaxID=546107 RepID=A0ABW3NHE4_9BACI
MFIHIGDDNVIQSREVVSIIDYELYTNTTGIYQMIQGWKRQNKVTGPEEEAKSIMITADHIYFSSLSVATLRKRTGILTTISNLDDYSEE